MKINVIIPNYNVSNIIIKNLSSVIESLENYPESKIIIVDDGSNESDYKKLKDFILNLDKKNSIELIRKDRNSGFSSTVNKGAFSSESDFLVLLNSDVSPDKNFISEALKNFENNKNLFGVGCMDKSQEEGKTVLRGRGLAGWNRGFLVHRKGEVDKKDTFWISGGSSVVRWEMFRELGGFDEIYDPFYWEDIDLSFRARKSGYEIVFDNKSQVVHRHDEGSIKKHFSKRKITKIAYRNQFIFVWKNITDPFLIFSHLVFLPYHFFRAILRFDLAFFEGFILALIRLPVIIKRRSDQKKFYKIPDKELLSPINEIINNNSSL